MPTIRRQIAIVLVAMTLGTLPALGETPKVSLNFNNADIREVLTFLSEQTGVNVVAAPGVNGRVSIGLKNVPLDEALKAILAANQLSYQLIGNTYVVSAPERPTGGAGTLGQGLPAGYPGRKVNVNLKNADIQFVLENLANQAGVDVVLFGTFNDRVTARLTNLSFEDALQRVLFGSKVTYSKRGNIYLIGDAGYFLQKSLGTLVSTKAYRLNFLKAKEALLLLPPNVSPTNIKVDEANNSFLVTGTQELMESMDLFLQEVDIPSQQVILEVTVLELSKKASKQLGLSFSGDVTGQLTLKDNPLQLVYDPDKQEHDGLKVTLKALFEEGDAKVRANPKVAASNGKQATINVGRVVNVRVTTGTQLTPITSLQTIEAGIKLQMTPYIGNAGEIICEINTEVSSITGRSAEGLPEISKRSATTTIRVKDGQTIVLGGLIQNDELLNETRVPILSDIPVVGSLFSNRNKTESESELVIMITPRLMKDGVTYEPTKPLALPSPQTVQERTP